MANTSDHTPAADQSAEGVFMAPSAFPPCPVCGTTGVPYWLNSKVDGTPNRRYKDNYLLCLDCHARRDDITPRQWLHLFYGMGEPATVAPVGVDPVTTTQQDEPAETVPTCPHCGSARGGYWKYMRVDGGPDRRYSLNHRLCWDCNRPLDTSASMSAAMGLALAILGTAITVVLFLWTTGD